jgi:Cu+-exporting ATPase
MTVHDHAHCAVPPAEAERAEARDPVCGMSVDRVNAKHRFKHAGEKYVFCCARCRAKFAADPDLYLHPPESQPVLLLTDETEAPDEAKTRTEAKRVISDSSTWTCPMHPEVVRPLAGDCPLCGMALEPAGIPVDGPNPEFVDMMRRLWTGAALASPLVVLDMGMHFDALDVPPAAAAGIEFALATPIVFWIGWPLLQRGWASLRNRSLNMFSLIALGVGTAYFYSVAASVLAFLWADPGTGDGAPPLYYEPAAVITVLVLLGQVLELAARERTGGAIKALLNLAPKTAWRLLTDSADEEIPLDQVRIGDRLRLKPGDSVPTDGVVLEGRSGVDEAMVTGEAEPVIKDIGDPLIGGTINGTGSLIMQAERVGADTMLARIVGMVAEAQRSRAPIQRLADVVSSWFVPAVLAVAFLAFLAWLIWGPAPAFANALIAAVSVVIIACPCALGLATPMAIMVGIGQGAGAGILIRDAEALERLEEIDTLVIDKTGTLTEGKPRLVDMIPVEGFDEARLLTLAASLEVASEHPLAAAIVTAALGAGLTLLPVENFNAVAGLGVTGRVAGKDVAVGTFLLSGPTFRASARQAEALQHQGATIVHVMVDGSPAGMLAIADPIKDSAPEALDWLREAGIRIVMLTGDKYKTAQAIAERLDIGEIEAEVRPDGKQAVIRRLKSEGRIVAMAGDGVNDAPALAAADVGIAMGTGTEVAIRSAGITLVKGDLKGIVRARALSHATMRNIRQNLALAFVYNVLGLPLAAGVLYPAFGLELSPIIAAAAMSLSSVSVIGNALRLRWFRL